MNEALPTYDNLERFLQVSDLNEKKRQLIINKLSKKLSIAFLVTNSFDIHIGITGEHKNIYENLPIDTSTLEKGRIMGNSRKIVWVTSDNHRNITLPAEDLVKLRKAIIEKINEALDLEYYIQ